MEDDDGECRTGIGRDSLRMRACECDCDWIVLVVLDTGESMAIQASSSRYLLVVLLVEKYFESALRITIFPLYRVVKMRK
jgi:hypothetical protein